MIMIRLLFKWENRKQKSFRTKIRRTHEKIFRQNKAKENEQLIMLVDTIRLKEKGDFLKKTSIKTVNELNLNMSIHFRDKNINYHKNF